MDAELVLDGVAMQVVAAAERAIIVHEELRHEEERDALRALRRIGKARQHEMNDVVGEIVFAVGDEDLLAEDAIGAIGRRSARVFMPPRSVPWPVSVRFIDPIHSPDTIFDRYFSFSRRKHGR